MLMEADPTTLIIIILHVQHQLLYFAIRPRQTSKLPQKGKSRFLPRQGKAVSSPNKFPHNCNINRNSTYMYVIQRSSRPLTKREAKTSICCFFKTTPISTPPPPPSLLSTKEIAPGLSTDTISTFLGLPHPKSDP